MSTITFVEHDGTQHAVPLDPGKSLMEHAVDHLVPGIDADCGGACACGTCHITLPEAAFAQLSAASSDEAQLLNMTPERTQTSRLACQIQATDAMDGMTVHLPEFQM